MLTISTLNQSSPIQIAQEELASYLNKMGIHCRIKSNGADIQLGLFEDFGKTASVKDAYWDDEFEISIKDSCGFIAGSNPRSVLFGIYRFLEENGARWVRPGKDGDYIPKISKLSDVSIREAAAHRHRTIIIEGAVSFEHLWDMLNWMPKRYYNQYLFQFSDIQPFLYRWYSHFLSPVREAEREVPKDFAIECTEKLKKRVQELGFILHQGGHCFTNEPFGVEFSGWDKNDDSDMSPEFLDICAQLDGKRGLWKRMVVATQLCYSNPYVRQTMANAVLDFLKKRPETDILFFCISDGNDNTCECEECSKLPVSDYFVMILNEIDRLLTAEGIDTKVSFSAYNNLSFTPKQEKLNNPDRFILAYCANARSRTRSWPHEYTIKKIPEYKVNNFGSVIPYKPEQSLAFLNNWKTFAKTPCFIFDYHLMWDHLLDAGHEAVARVLYNDIRAFRPLGIDGIASCQLQRNFFPTSISMTVMGKTLWNPDIAYKDIQVPLYEATFGEDNARKVIDYLETLSSCYDMDKIFGQEPCNKQEFTERMNKAIKTIADFVPFIEAHLDATEPCQKTAWRTLLHHAKIYTKVSNIILLRLNKQEEQAKELIKETILYGFRNEDELHEVLDTHYFTDVMNQRLTPVTEEDFVGPELDFDAWV